MAIRSFVSIQSSPGRCPAFKFRFRVILENAIAFSAKFRNISEIVTRLTVTPDGWAMAWPLANHGRAIVPVLTLHAQPHETRRSFDRRHPAGEPRRSLVYQFRMQ